MAIAAGCLVLSICLCVYAASLCKQGGVDVKKPRIESDVRSTAERAYAAIAAFKHKWPLSRTYD